MGCLLSISDNLQTSLKAGAVCFHPLLVTLLKFSKNQRWRHITTRKTIYAYLPVHFRNENDISVVKDSNFNNLPRSKNGVSRFAALEPLHECAELNLKNVIQCTLQGLTCRSANTAEILFHIVLTTYVADKPDSEKTLSIKRWYANFFSGSESPSQKRKFHL